MSLDWTHQFCLACDKQTDGSTYCSESCRLADFEKTSSSASSSASNSLTSQPASWSWTSPKPASTGTKFYLSPEYDFSNRTPIGSSLGEPAAPRGQSSLSPPALVLSPSSSHTSLCSMQSSASTNNDGAQLSEKARRELRAYAISFESVRLQRRRSY